MFLAATVVSWIGRDSACMSRFNYFFQNGVFRPSARSSWCPFSSVFIVVQNLVGIDAVVSIILVLIVCMFGLKMPIHAPPNWGFGGYDPRNGVRYQQNP